MEGGDDESSVLAQPPQKKRSQGFLGALTFSDKKTDRNQQVEELSVPPAVLLGPLCRDQN